MKWNNGYSASYYAYIIDPVSWREKERIEITGGSISRSEDGLRESADIECKAYEHGKEQYIRVYLDARQNGAASHEPHLLALPQVHRGILMGISRRTRWSVTPY